MRHQKYIFGLVGERNAYMADGLNRLEPFNTIVAVVGLAHVDGIEHYNF
jgi:pheromone shutdown protein TraB